MKNWLRGKPGGLLAFALIAALVAGGLGWATDAALRLEREALAERAARRAEERHAARLRVALWRLDGRVRSLLAREESRPFHHYSALSAPPVALVGDRTGWHLGAALEPSPLLGAKLPAWMRLHFQAGAAGWQSPQVLSSALEKRLRDGELRLALGNVTPARRELLEGLTVDLPGQELVARARRQAKHDPLVNAMRLPAPNALAEFTHRRSRVSPLDGDPGGQQLIALEVATRNVLTNGEGWLSGPRAPLGRAEVMVELNPMTGLWLTTASGADLLVVLRLVRVGVKELCQGIVLDAGLLQRLLAEEVQDLFPGARVLPLRESVPEAPERALTALPFQLDPGPVAAEAAAPGWTPLRAGLSLAWAAAGVALLAVALGGWSLLDLSERRIRFVSAVTHELRTPLTTLRLYLDMLVHGMVRDEAQRADYLRTLHAEADRLHRLVGNVLDFSRLERQRPRLARAEVPVADLLGRVAATWRGRCHDGGKELVVECALAPGAAVCTDAELLEQVLGNLLDNACKYSRGAADARVWLRARGEGSRVVFEVEDRGPGVPRRERRAVFRAFRRGEGADVIAGGVGLGLALARRWARLLGGRLTLAHPAEGGAGFRVELPAG